MPKLPKVKTNSKTFQHSAQSRDQKHTTEKKLAANERESGRINANLF